MSTLELIKNSRIKWPISLFILVICFVLGAGILRGILFLNGIPIDDNQSLVDLLANPEKRWVIRLAFGASHFVGFILSSFAIGAILGYIHMPKIVTWIKGFQVKQLAAWLMLLLVCYPFAGALGYLAGKIPLPEWLSEAEDSSYRALEGLITMEDSWQLLGNLIIIAIIPGVGEEMFFRGIIQTYLQNRYRSQWIVLLASAFIFAAFHLQFAGFFPKLVIGWVLAASYYYTQNLIYPILIHMINNGFQVWVAYLHPERIEESADIPAPTGVQVMLVVLTLPVIYILFQYITKKYKDGRSIENET